MICNRNIIISIVLICLIVSFAKAGLTRGDICRQHPSPTPTHAQMFHSAIKEVLHFFDIVSRVRKEDKDRK